MNDHADRVRGVLLGTALGDSLGLPREGLSPGRGAALYGADCLRQRLLFGRGMVSDDTEHTCMVAQALLASGDDPERFARSFAWRLRGWSLALPVSLGWGTARALVKLWLGFSPNVSGVRSAGNGPSMRAALFGACFAHDEALLARFVRASTRITHNDDLAEEAALSIALAAARGARSGGELGEPGALLDGLAGTLHNAPLREAITTASDFARRGESGHELARALGLERGVTGYSLHTAPIALFCWAKHGGAFGPSVAEAISLGGDTDTVGAIVGALSGATQGASTLPRELLDRLCEWPRNVAWMGALADRVAARFPPGGPPKAGPGPLGWFWPGVVARNLFFLVVVLAHGFRRLAPPYGPRSPRPRAGAREMLRRGGRSAGPRPSAGVRAQHVEEPIEGPRLEKVSGRPHRRGFAGPLVVGRQDDDRNRRELAVAQLLGPKRPPAHHGHRQIEHDEVGPGVASQKIERLAPIARARHHKALFFEHQEQNVAHVVIVFDHEHGEGFFRHRTPDPFDPRGSAPLRRSATHQRCSLGSRTAFAP